MEMEHPKKRDELQLEGIFQLFAVNENVFRRTQQKKSLKSSEKQ